MKIDFFFFYCGRCVCDSWKDFPPLLSRAQLSRCSGFICFRQWPILLLYLCLRRATFPDSRCKTTPPARPLHLPKEEKSLSKNLLRVAASKLSQFIHTPPRCSTSATNYLYLGSHGMSSKSGDFHRNPFCSFSGPGFYYGAVPEPAAFVLGICTGRRL